MLDMSAKFKISRDKLKIEYFEHPNPIIKKYNNSSRLVETYTIPHTKLYDFIKEIQEVTNINQPKVIEVTVSINELRILSDIDCNMAYDPKIWYDDLINILFSYYNREYDGSLRDEEPKIMLGAINSNSIYNESRKDDKRYSKEELKEYVKLIRSQKKIKIYFDSSKHFRVTLKEQIDIIIEASKKVQVVHNKRLMKKMEIENEKMCNDYK